MADGNGRISRFLINDVLRRDGAIPEPFILPVSATITSSTGSRRGYDQLMEVFSKPPMKHYRDQYHFGPETTAEDGIRYDLYFKTYDDAYPTWRYPDLIEHVEYLTHVVDLTINEEMRKEATYLRSIRTARAQIKEIIEGPDSDIDRIIRSVRDNEGRISNKLRKDFTLMDDPEVGQDVVRIIQMAFGLPISNDFEDSSTIRPG